MKTPVERFAKRKHDEVIVVKLWVAYLRSPSGNLLDALCNYSMDSAPFAGPQNERLTFRFSRNAWEDKVKGLLYEHRVPVIIQSNPLYAQSRGTAVSLI